MQALFSPLRIGRFLRRLRPAFAATLIAATGGASAAGFVCAVRSLRGGRSPGPWGKAPPIDIAHGAGHPPRIRAPLRTLAR